MKKLKLQVQVTVDGFNGDPDGNLDWHFAVKWSKDLIDYVNNLTDSCDTILLGRKMTDGFISAWTSQLEDENNPNYAFAKKMIDTSKVVFSKTLTDSKWANTTLATGDLKEDVKRLKNGKGKDIIVYGGTTFVSSLIKDGLIDELHLFINPVIIGKGTSIFNAIEKAQNLKLIKAIGFECGMALLVYKPSKN
ncbi:MAG: dihydrofolate reductase family protein [Candidatus Thorarchaeota archaeon]